MAFLDEVEVLSVVVPVDSALDAGFGWVSMEELRKDTQAARGVQVVSDGWRA